MEMIKEGWAPIGSAPRDGTTVLLVSIEDGEASDVVAMQWSHIKRNGIFPGVVGMWTTPCGSMTWSEEIPEYGPTHWKPEEACPSSN